MKGVEPQQDHSFLEWKKVRYSLVNQRANHFIGVTDDTKAEFIAERGEDYVYESLLGDREPPLDYRQ